VTTLFAGGEKNVYSKRPTSAERAFLNYANDSELRIMGLGAMAKLRAQSQGLRETGYELWVMEKIIDVSFCELGKRAKGRVMGFGENYAPPT
jgi:hypothetical protein